MKNEVNRRVSVLLKTLGIDASEAALRLGKQPNFFYRIINEQSTPTKTSLQLIADHLGANIEWLKTGKGAMMQIEKTNKLDESKESLTNPWRDALVADLKGQIEYLKELLKITMQGKQGNFLKLLNETGPIKRALRRAA